MTTTTNHILAVAAVFPLALGACVEGDAEDDTAALSVAETAITGGDLTPEPLPSPSELISASSVFGVNPGTRACFLELSANQSAGIGGSFSFQSFVKYPKLIVFWRRTTGSTQSKIFTGDVVPDASGFFQKVFNTSNGNAGLFPGLFQFCLRNPSVNPGPFFSNATVVTF